MAADNLDLEDIKQQRSQRKFRAHKTAITTIADKLERRHGWGYVKRRHIVTEE